MKQWIEYSLKCRKGQAGFALPVAIGMGLIILLVGLTMLLRSQDSQVSAIAQKDTAKSLNAAETGVNEIRALINQHRAIAKYPACVNRDTSGSCLDTGSTESWFLPNNISNIFAECNVNETNAATEIISVAQRTWRPVDPNAPDQGEYRLFEYTNLSGPVGTLIVQGRVNADQPSESISELEVDFPVDQVKDQIAGLWVKDTTDINQINSDILGACSTSITAQPQNEFAVKRLNLLMPSPPPTAGGNTIPETLIGPGTYQYSITEINTTTVLPTVNSDQVVEIWVDGNIDLENKEVEHNCGDIKTCGPFTYKIYGTAGSGTIKLNKGTLICDVFIHAPNYDVINSDGGSTPTKSCGKDTWNNDTKNTGVFWVNSWNDNGNVRTPILDPPRASWADALDVYPPRIGAIKDWATQKRSDI